MCVMAAVEKAEQKRLRKSAKNTEDAPRSLGGMSDNFTKFQKTRSEMLIKQQRFRARKTYSIYRRLRCRGLRMLRWAGIRWRHKFEYYEPDSKLIADSQQFWNDHAHPRLKARSHFAGEGPFADTRLWSSLGAEHARMFEKAAQWIGMDEPLERIVEWGCGGGLYAAHFAPKTQMFCGVDINPQSLDECAKQVEKAGLTNFHPVLIDSNTPRDAVSQIAGPCDLFFSTYVFELLPTEDYGLEIMRIAFDILRSGGLALIQIHYDTGALDHKSRPWGYAENLAKNNSYRMDAFWLECQKIGFVPLFIILIPERPEISDDRYAYFALQKPEYRP